MVEKIASRNTLTEKLQADSVPDTVADLGVGGRVPCAPLPPDQDLFIFMQFSGKFGQLVGWRPLWRPLWKSWIRYWDMCDTDLLTSEANDTDNPAIPGVTLSESATASAAENATVRLPILFNIQLIHLQNQPLLKYYN